MEGDFEHEQNGENKGKEMFNRNQSVNRSFISIKTRRKYLQTMAVVAQVAQLQSGGLHIKHEYGGPSLLVYREAFNAAKRYLLFFETHLQESVGMQRYHS